MIHWGGVGVGGGSYIFRHMEVGVRIQFSLKNVSASGGKPPPSSPDPLTDTFYVLFF